VKTPGIVINPRARGVAEHPAWMGRLERRLPRGHVHVTHDEDELDPALRELAERGVDTLVIVGGDGSAGTTLTRGVALWPEAERPRVLLAGGGTVNTLARSLGARGNPLYVVDRLLREGDRVRETVRPLVRVEPEDGEVRHGLIFANGLATRFLELYYGDSPRGVRGAIEVVARALGSAFVHGPLAQRMFARFPARVSVDGEALSLGEMTIMGAGSVRDVGLGFRPFLSAGDYADRIHFVVSDASGLRLAAELPALRLGLHGAHSCLRHFPAQRVEIRLAEPEAWTLDADFHPPTASLVVSAGPRIRFLSLE